METLHLGNGDAAGAARVTQTGCGSSRGVLYGGRQPFESFMVVPTRNINAAVIKGRPSGMIMAAGGEDASHVEFLAQPVVCLHLVPVAR